MLDRRLLLNDPDAVRAVLQRRHASEEALSAVDRFHGLEQERRELTSRGDELRRFRNKTSSQIGAMMKAGRREEAEEIKAQVRQASEELKGLEPRRQEIERELDEILLGLPNMLDEVVPDGKSEEENRVELVWGEAPEMDFDPLPHDELGAALGILDMEAAARMSGSRFSVLKGPGARLERALISFFLDFHTSQHGYEEVMVPYVVWRSAMTGTGQLPKFEEDLFKLSEPVNGQDAFLIPTAEVPVTNLVREEILEEEELPKAWCAFTPCFRAEAGSYGRDTKGLIRQHQFHKVELVKITTPERSREEHEALTRDAESILQALGLHYRKVRVCAGDASAAALNQLDLEVWLPSQGRFREISSCSCFGDYQARRMNLRYRKAPGSQGKKTAFCHTMNGSGLAVGRTLVAILENYQQADGSVIIPEVLKPYMGGLARIERVR